MTMALQTNETVQTVAKKSITELDRLIPLDSDDDDDDDGVEDDDSCAVAIEHKSNNDHSEKSPRFVRKKKKNTKLDEYLENYPVTPRTHHQMEDRTMAASTIQSREVTVVEGNLISNMEQLQATTTDKTTMNSNHNNHAALQQLKLPWFMTDKSVRTSLSRKSRIKRRGDSLERDISETILQTASLGADEAHFCMSQKSQDTFDSHLILQELNSMKSTSSEPQRRLPRDDVLVKISLLDAEEETDDDDETEDENENDDNEKQLNAPDSQTKERRDENALIDELVKGVDHGSPKAVAPPVLGRSRSLSSRISKKSRVRIRVTTPREASLLDKSISKQHSSGDIVNINHISPKTTRKPDPPGAWSSKSDSGGSDLFDGITSSPRSSPELSNLFPENSPQQQQQPQDDEDWATFQSSSDDGLEWNTKSKQVQEIKPTKKKKNKKRQKKASVDEHSKQEKTLPNERFEPFANFASPNRRQVFIQQRPSKKQEQQEQPEIPDLFSMSNKNHDKDDTFSPSFDLPKERPVDLNTTQETAVSSLFSLNNDDDKDHDQKNDHDDDDEEWTVFAGSIFENSFRPQDDTTRLTTLSNETPPKTKTTTACSKNHHQQSQQLPDSPTSVAVGDFVVDTTLGHNDNTNNNDDDDDDDDQWESFTRQFSI